MVYFSVKFYHIKVHPQISKAYCTVIVGVLSKPSIPTAQVYPSPITTAKYGSTAVNGHGGDTSYGLKHGWESDTISTTTLTDTTVLDTTATHINSTRGDVSRLLKDDDFELSC